MKYLGEQFEIHTGGIDHIPVHHTNEIAQAEAATEKVPFVKYWVHHNFLRIDNEKMSKSLGNFYTIDDILERNYTPQALRLLFLSSHYRSELNFTWESLAAAQTAWERLVAQVGKIRQAALNRQDSHQPAAESVEALPEYKSFFAAIGHDLDTPAAMAQVWQVLNPQFSAPEQYRLLLEFDQILGLGLAKISQSNDSSGNLGESELDVASLATEIQNLFDARNARVKKFGCSRSIETNS
jgi:cysteinyl-tRNA synthetase